MRLEQISPGRRVIPLLIEKLSQLLKAGRQRKVGAAKARLAISQGLFRNAQSPVGATGSWHAGIQFVVEDGPKLFFFTFHYSYITKPSLIWVPVGSRGPQKQSLTLIPTQPCRCLQVVVPITSFGVTVVCCPVSSANNLTTSQKLNLARWLENVARPHPARRCRVDPGDCSLCLLYPHW